MALLTAIINKRCSQISPNVLNIYIYSEWAKYDLFILAKLFKVWNADHESFIGIHWETVRHKYLRMNIYPLHATWC